ncbi:hypothetical protein GNG26_09940 [Leclercia sp. J807]|uniref:hypothetical protein n=1 Tax=Leclercia sp. J807 TaxID=2681307 RepID=UPI0012E2B6ED|nr:hypothetical protein [Leclercia sp. J807]QGU10654.1 hypothetical protein GNG26_09940 [Leclercia sp. J807]
MSIKTYAVNCNDAWLNTEGDDISGSYVKYKDHQDVVAELEAKCAALAAENAALKSFGDKLAEMHNDLNGEGTGIQGCAEVACQQVALEAAMEEFDAIKTPATDAFLAEVRAQVWIEGNVPAEFGRYWVRYETDVGPQYCSAKWMEYNFCAGSDTNIHKIWLADHSRSINSLKGVTHYTMLPEPIEGGAK